MFDIAKQIFGFLFKNPLFVWIWTWNIHIIMVSLIVCYYVFTGLKSIGVIDLVQNETINILDNTLNVAAACPQTLAGGNINAFWQCIQNPPNRDRNNEYERNVMKTSGGLMNKIKQYFFGVETEGRVPDNPNSSNNPYDTRQ
jgi:hypothetical protein